MFACTCAAIVRMEHAAATATVDHQCATTITMRNTRSAVVDARHFNIIKTIIKKTTAAEVTSVFLLLFATTSLWFFRPLDLTAAVRSFVRARSFNSSFVLQLHLALRKHLMLQLRQESLLCDWFGCCKELETLPFLLLSVVLLLLLGVAVLLLVAECWQPARAIHRPSAHFWQRRSEM